MDEQNKNLLLASALSFLVIVVWFWMFPPPEQPAQPETPTPAQVDTAMPEAAPGPAAAPPAAGSEGTATDAADAPRVKIDTPSVAGSISLMGGRIDDLSLKQYHETIEPGSPAVTILSPASGGGATHVLFGWGAAGEGAAGDLPGPGTLWTQTGGSTLSVGQPVTLGWTNEAGLSFTRTVAIDEDYMFTVTDKVTNSGTAPASLYAYGVVERSGLPANLRKFFILHEGLIRVADGKLAELDYDDVTELPPLAGEGGPAEKTEVAAKGWIGFTDHYWQTMLVPRQGSGFEMVAKYLPGSDIYRSVVRQPAVTLAPGESAEASTLLFSGPKEWEAIRGYQDALGIDRFVDSIDWGWFFFLTKPIFAVLHWLNGMIGNMGLSIIALTFLLKALLFPLARKSYVSMARMKELQPELEKLKERTGDDRQKLQKEMMELYKREKVNPAAGCLPILLQIPIFFSLYKVIFVTFELRQASFFGPFQDLSAPDPTSIMNLYGLLPWAGPEPGSFLALIFIGILPLLLGISMWLQQKLNPAPTDPAQAMIFAWMPWIFMFMLGGFASGLVVYWITNNTITFIQQYAIMRSHGYKPDIWGNIRAGARARAANKDDKPAPRAKK